MIPDPVGDAVAWVRGGGLLAYPTETVWGLGADATSEEAIAKLQRWKGRGPANPLSVLVERPADLDALEVTVPGGAQRLAERFWPGPLTLVLTCARVFAPGVARDDGAIGVRCSSHPLAAALARRLRNEGAGPVTSTSLNRSGDEPARDAEAAHALCGDGEDDPRMLAVEGAEAGSDRESTVVDATGAELRVLRWGAYGEAELGPVLGEAHVS